MWTHSMQISLSVNVTLNVSGTASETIKLKVKSPQARISKLVKIVYLVFGIRTFQNLPTFFRVRNETVFPKGVISAALKHHLPLPQHHQLRKAWIHITKTAPLAKQICMDGLMVRSGDFCSSSHWICFAESASGTGCQVNITNAFGFFFLINCL